MRISNKNSNAEKAVSGFAGKGRGILLSVLLALSLTLALFCLSLTSCRREKNPGGGGNGDPDYSCAGVYYAPSGEECQLDLGANGSFTLVFGGESLGGSYTFRDGAITLDFSAEGKADASAAYESGIVTLTLGDATMRLLLKVDYTVRFETNGGGAIADIKVTSGRVAEKPADPVKENYIFVGWYRDSEYTKPHSFTSDIITADTTLYARWIADEGLMEHTVSFDICYEGGAAPESMPTVGGVLFGMPVPEREGYDFLGWWVSTDNDSERLSYKVNGETVFRADTTLYALWREAGGTKIEPPSLTLSEDGVSWKSVEGARSYDLTLTDEDGTVHLSMPLSTTYAQINFDEYPAGSFTVTVRANANGAEEDSSEAYYSFVNRGLEKVSEIFVSDDGTTLVFGEVPGAEKYLITVICGNKDHTHTDFDNGTSKTFSFAGCPMPDEGIRFIVKAVAEGYVSSVSDEFVYKRELGSVSDFSWNAEDSVLSFGAVENAEYYMVSVSCGDAAHSHGFLNIGKITEIDLKECTPLSGGITVKVYPVAWGYISSEPAEFKVNKTALGTPGNITLSGSVISWDAVAGAEKYEISLNGSVYAVSGTSFDLASISPAEDDTVYVVRLRAVGGESSSWSNPQEYYVNAFADAPVYSKGMLTWNPVIGAEYYEVRVNGGEVHEVRDSVSLAVTLTRAGNNTLELRFTRGGVSSEWVSTSVFAYTVSFDTLGGSNIAPVYSAAGDEITLPATAKAGYDFVSWYNVPGGPAQDGREIPDVMTVSESVTVYAYYTPKKYEIIYNVGSGGTCQTGGGTVDYGRDYTLDVPTSDDATVSFGGWFEAPHGKGVQYTDGSGKSLSPWNTLGGAEVYAFWIDGTLEFTPVKVNGRNAYSVSMGPKIALVSEITVPAYHNGLPVAMIEGNAFLGCAGLQVINIPATVEVVSSLDPFAGCTSLNEINVYAVDGVGSPRYSSVSGVLFSGDEGRRTLVRIPLGKGGEYAVPDGTSEISEGAFANTSITSVTVSADVTKIGNDAFSGAGKLKTVYFAVSDGAGELTIGKRAFANCTSLSGITLPARLSSVDLGKYYVSDGGDFIESFDFAFVGCSSLEAIGVAPDSSSYKVIDGMIYSADSSTLIYCPTAREGRVTLNMGSQFIGAGAFVGCSGITEIIIPNTFVYIGEYAFAGISAERIVFEGRGHNEVTLGDYAFAYAKKLSSVEFGEGSRISVIGEGAFSGCTALTEFTITSTVTSVRDNAFENCSGLSAVIFAGGESALEFGKNVFLNCTSLTTVEIPANVSKIPGIFSGCASLTEVRVDPANQSFVSVDGVVFSSDGGELVYFPQGKGGEYVIPEGVTSIGAGVFNGNTELSSIVIPLSVSYIGEEAFKATDLGSITFEGGTPAESLVIARSAFEGAAFEGYELVLPDHTKEIGDYAFSGVYYEKIVLNEGLERIGNYAFYLPRNDSELTNPLVIPASVESIGEYCFGGESIENSYVSAHLFMDVQFTLENSRLTEIGDFAFYKNVKLTSAILPDSVKTIGNYAFYECSSLTEVKLPASLEVIGAYAFGASANTYQVPISSITIPGGVSLIGARAFENCQLLTSVIFEGGKDSPDLTVGGSYRRRYEGDGGTEMFSVERGNVFAGCTRLTEVVLSPNVVTLGDYCFTGAGDTGFTVTVPENSRLTTIGAFCFYKSRLVSFTVPASVRNLEPIEEYGSVYDRPGIGNYAFAATHGKLTEIIFEDGGSAPLTIGYGAFENQSGLTSIELPARLAPYASAGGEIISPLGGGALVFYGASSLTDITVREGCPYTVSGGVLYTADLTEAVFCPTSLEGGVVIPASVNAVGSYAFLGCSKITSLSFAAGSKLTFIGDYAFYGISGVSNITLPSGVTSIGERAFGYAGALASITLPARLESFDIAVLDGCAALQNIYVGEGSESFASVGGVLYNIGKTKLILYPMGREDKEYTVLGTTLVIDNRAFGGNRFIESVVLPVGLGEIAAGAFDGCSALRTVVIPKTTELIGERAFADTSALSGLTFAERGGEKLVIADGAFAGSAISSITLPAGIISIGNDAFRGSALSSLNFDGADKYQLTEIGDYAFAGTQLVSVSLPSGVKTVGIGAFLGTGTLDEVSFGAGLESVGADAFRDSGAERVVFPESLGELGAYAFYNCRWLKSVSFGRSALTAIREGSFFGCISLTEITIPAGVTEILGGEGSGAFFGCTALTSVKFESDGNLSTIGSYAFSGCTSLAGISIPVSTGEIGSYAFSGCTSLTEITIHRATVKLGEGMLSGCTSLSEVEMDTGTDRLPAKMFENCESLKRIFIPANVADVGEGCFTGTAVEGFDVAEDNKNFVSVSGIVYNASKTEIVCFPPRLTVDTLIIPKEVIRIDEKVFQYCTGIRAVVFEEGSRLTEIGDYAFDGCYNVRSVTLPESLTSIGRYAFRECYALVSITIPKNVREIGDSAFSKCAKLYDVCNESELEIIPGKTNTGLDYLNLNEYVGAKVNIYTPSSGAPVTYTEGGFVFATVNGTKRIIGYNGTSDVVVLPEGSYEIAPYLFSNDTFISTVIIPSTVAMGEHFIFENCTSLKAILISGGDAPESWPEGWNSTYPVFGGYNGNTSTYTFDTPDGVRIDPIISSGAISLPEVELDGYIFMGWYDNAEYSGEPLGSAYYSPENITLYASLMTEEEYVDAFLRGNTMEYAYEIESGRTYDVEIKEKKAQKYFTLTVEAGDVWTIRTPRMGAYHKLYIYDEQGNEITTYTSPATGTYDIDLDYTFTKSGTYYIGLGFMSSYVSSGAFTVTFTEK